MIKRDAFVYLEPKGDGADFAQCGTCRDFDADRGRCAILGPEFEVGADDSCGVYIEGRFQHPTIRKLTTPEAVGFVRRKVRCENCKFGGKICKLYARLNHLAPGLFDLDEKIHPKACCNAQQPKAGG